MNLISSLHNQVQNETNSRKLTPKYQKERGNYDALLANDLQNYKVKRRRDGLSDMTKKEEREWIRAYKDEYEMPENKTKSSGKKSDFKNFYNKDWRKKNEDTQEFSSLLDPSWDGRPAKK